MRCWRALVLAVSLLATAAAFVAPAAAGPLPSASSNERTLPELKAPPSLELGRPEAADLAELDALLARITGPESQDREAAVRELLEAEPKQVTAIRFRIGSIAPAPRTHGDARAQRPAIGRTRAARPPDRSPGVRRPS